MQFRTAAVAAILLLSLVTPAATGSATAQSCSFPETMTDGSGSQVTVQDEPQRVVTLGPSAAQTMWEIGAREKVVGLSKHASYLEGAESRTRISTSEQLVSNEAVVALEPDLVLAPHVISNERVAKLREAGMTVFYFSQAETIEDVSEKTHRIGRLTGECSAAEATVASMQERISAARVAAEGKERPDVLYLFFGHTAGEKTFINELIEAAGGNNIAADENITGYQQLNSEVAIREDPDWLVLNSENPAGLNADVLNQTTAVRENQTAVVQIEHLNQAAPRIVRAVTTLAKRFHPDAYATATPNRPATTTPSADSTTATTTPTAATDPGGIGQPGFGVPVIFVAVVASLCFLLGRGSRGRE